MQLNLGGEAKPVQPQSERTTAPCHKREEKATYFFGSLASYLFFNRRLMLTNNVLASKISVLYGVS